MGCCDDNCGAEILREGQRVTLKVVLGINAVMFLVIAAAAAYAKSTALLSDSLDNLGDALTYGLSLYAVTQGARTKAKVALFKGSLIFAAACVVISQIVNRLLNPVVPVYEVMGIFSVIGLLANGACLWLLWRHRKDDVNMGSVWECSRNDIASNLSVLAAAAAVWTFNSWWPDVIVASCLAALLLGSSLRVARSALAGLR